MLSEGFIQGARLLFSLNPDVWGAVWVSVMVSFVSTVAAGVVSAPFGVMIGASRFRGRRVVISAVNTLMALPTVLIGLVAYAVLSRSGPFGALELLYTPTAMIIGESILIFPVMVSFCAGAVEKSDDRIVLTAYGLGATRFQALRTLIWEVRSAIMAAIAAGFGRSISEVGVAMMLGGNLKGYTRNLTTGIAFETGKGEFATGVALGLVLLVIAIIINSGMSFLQGRRKGVQ